MTRTPTFGAPDRVISLDDTTDSTQTESAGRPRVWVLADDMLGHTNQCVGLAEELGWPWELKTLEFNRLERISNLLLGPSVRTLRPESARKLSPPWPDLVLCAGRRLTPPALWIGRQSGGQARLVQLGRKGGNRADPFDLVVSCTHFGQLPHPRRLAVLTPVNRVTEEVLAEQAARWREHWPQAERAPIALLVGGSCGTHRLDGDTATRMGRDVSEFARDAERRVVVVTSRRTSPEATRALERALGDACSWLYRWRPADSENPYWGCLALAAALVVTGESESMLAEASATGKPLYIYPIPERPSLRRRIAAGVAARARHPAQHGTCAWLVERGLVHVPRDLGAMHRALVAAGRAHAFGAPFDAAPRAPLRETARVAARVRELLEAG